MTDGGRPKRRPRLADIDPVPPEVVAQAKASFASSARSGEGPYQDAERTVDSVDEDAERDSEEPAEP